MVQKAEAYGTDFLPEMSAGQNKRLSGRFWECFAAGLRERMERILEAGKYVPQEILNAEDIKQDDQNTGGNPCSTIF